MWWNNDTNCEKDTERYFLCSNAHSAFASNVRECIFVQCQCVGGRLDTHSDTHTHTTGLVWVRLRAHVSGIVAKITPCHWWSHWLCFSGNLERSNVHGCPLTHLPCCSDYSGMTTSTVVIAVYALCFWKWFECDTAMHLCQHWWLSMESRGLQLYSSCPVIRAALTLRNKTKSVSVLTSRIYINIPSLGLIIGLQSKCVPYRVTKNV